MRAPRWLPLAALLAGCAETRSPVEPPPPAPPAAVCASTDRAPAPTLDLDPLFDRAAGEHGVPPALLRAVAWAETRWRMVQGEEELGRAAARGVMGLRGAMLRRGAELAGVGEAEAATDPLANLRAGAALLRALAADAGAEPRTLAEWAPAVAAFSGIDLEAGRAAYLDAVYATLRRGVRRDDPAEGALATLDPAPPEPGWPAARRSMAPAAAPDFAGAVWRPSPNFNQRAADETGRVALVIIHTCEGNYAGCWGWLANPQSGVSAHYVINEEGTEVSQLVEERSRAWHIGARYDCANNVGLHCGLNGAQSNHFTIGIEHAGFAAQPTWPAGQIETSARLVCDAARRWGIPLDHLRIAAHGQLQPENRTDPGPNWPWAAYLDQIRARCGGATPASPVVVVDDAETAAGATRFAAPGWTRTSATRGYFGTGYTFAAAGTAGEPATFHFHNPAAGPRTVGARWTAGANRAARAPFTMVGSDGRVIGTVPVSQKGSGGRWVSLGSWNFPAGASGIRLERGTDAGCVVVADAVLVN